MTKYTIRIKYIFYYSQNVRLIIRILFGMIWQSYKIKNAIV